MKRTAAICLIILALSAARVATADAFSCTISTTPLNFGVYDAFSTFPLDSTGTVSIACKNPERKPLLVTVTVSSGNSGSFNPRQMQSSSGSDRLSYYLFTDSSRTTIWGDGTGGTSAVTNLVSRDQAWTATIYARIPPLQNVRTGSYSDAATMTIIW